MVDYFGYDVQFVMNITDIDDKVRPLVISALLLHRFSSSTFPSQIIQRARYKYLTGRLRDQSLSLTPEVISSIDQAFSSYIQTKLAKSLSSSDLPPAGTERSAWPKLYESFKTDAAWVKSSVERDEKFSMHMNSLVCGSPFLNTEWDN